jgi:hypothetical protein
MLEYIELMPHFISSLLTASDEARDRRETAVADKLDRLAQELVQQQHHFAGWRKWAESKDLAFWQMLSDFEFFGRLRIPAGFSGNGGILIEALKPPPEALLVFDDHLEHQLDRLIGNRLKRLIGNRLKRLSLFCLVNFSYVLFSFFLFF